MSFEGDFRTLLRALREERRPLPGMVELCRLKVMAAENKASRCADADERADLLQIAESWRWAEARIKARTEQYNVISAAAND